MMPSPHFPLFSGAALGPRCRRYWSWGWRLWLVGARRQKGAPWTGAGFGPCTSLRAAPTVLSCKMEPVLLGACKLF